MDLAAATRKTAAAVLEWTEGGARLVHLSLDVTDEEIVELFGIIYPRVGFTGMCVLN